ncbi:MAG: hypothetical protein KatS3mg061_1372 [Dehalococcoidia bacterium]|nr:MAG: hypothetical protein KatS3mg061_1372 [Dehalococcoidia bacterium]
MFGTRFTRGTTVRAYPLHKLIVNRLANTFIQVLFRTRYNDMTNAFKGFRTDVVRDLMPLLANHFNMTVELPLKALNRGYRFAVVPVNWYGRTAGVSRLSIRTMGRKYLFTVLYLWLERHLMRDELGQRPLPEPTPLPPGTLPPPLGSDPAPPLTALVATALAPHYPHRFPPPLVLSLSSAFARGIRTFSPPERAAPMLTAELAAPPSLLSREAVTPPQPTPGPLGLQWGASRSTVAV